MRSPRTRSLGPILALASIVLLRPPATGAGRTPCDLANARPAIERWLGAWDFMSREVMRLPDAAAPDLVLYDSLCVYTTSAASAPRAAATRGPALHGKPLRWRVAAHDDTLTAPNGDRLPVQLMSFANSDRRSGPYFVMALPEYWRQKGIGVGQGHGVTPVFLHEFAHTRQVRGMLHIIGPIDRTWSGPRELDDDAVQHRFGTDSVYVAAYLAERDLFYRAAAAESIGVVRALAAQALAMMRERHARWFTGKDSVYAILDDLWLSMEGAGQWVGYAWLSHPKGGGMTHDAAVARMLGRRRWWAQDESLAIFLVLDRLDPEWPPRVFHEPSMGVLALLDRALANGEGRPVGR